MNTGCTTEVRNTGTEFQRQRHGASWPSGLSLTLSERCRVSLIRKEGWAEGILNTSFLGFLSDSWKNVGHKEKTGRGKYHSLWHEETSTFQEAFTHVPEASDSVRAEVALLVTGRRSLMLIFPLSLLLRTLFGFKNGDYFYHSNVK